MKYIKVITEVRKELFEKELANYMSQGFDIKFSNITYSTQNIIKPNSDMVTNYKEKEALASHIIYYALLVKETNE